MDNKKIGLFLQGLRKQRNLTQQDLALHLNVTHQSVSKWENGDSIPDISLLVSLAAFYRITVDEILQGEINQSVKLLENKNDINKWNLIRLIISSMVFMSLFLYYVYGLVNIGDLNPFPEWDPFNMNELNTVINLRGFNLIFNATGVSLFTIGGWIIFLSLLVLITFYGIITFYDNHDLLNKYFILVKIARITLLSGYGFILLGAVFIDNMGLNIGYFIGLLFSIGLYFISYLEKKQVTI